MPSVVKNANIYYSFVDSELFLSLGTIFKQQKVTNQHQMDICLPLIKGGKQKKHQKRPKKDEKKCLKIVLQ